MGFTINISDDTNVELDEVNINVCGNAIEFAVEGEISDIPPSFLDEFIGNQLKPVEITFERDY